MLPIGCSDSLRSPISVNSREGTGRVSPGAPNWVLRFFEVPAADQRTMTVSAARQCFGGIHHYYAFLVVLLLSAICCEAKIKQGSAHLTGETTENTLSKFALSPLAQGKVVLELHSKDMYVDETGLRLHMYQDSDWPRVKKAPTCAEKVRLAKKAVPISFELNNNPSKEKLNRHKKSKSKERGLWEARVKTSIPGYGTDRPQYWYLTLDDCSLEVYLHDNQAPQMEYTLTVLDEVSGTQVNQDVFKEKADYRHTPADENGMARLHVITAIVSVVLFLLIGYKIFSSIQTGGSVHAALLIMAITALCDGFSSIFELVHLATYENNGIGSYSLDALSAHFEAMSDSLVALVLLSVGSGWTLPSDVLSSSASGPSGGGILNKLVCVLDMDRIDCASTRKNGDLTLDFFDGCSEDGGSLIHGHDSRFAGGAEDAQPIGSVLDVKAQ